MASTARAYNNSGGGQSENSPFDLLPLAAAADLHLRKRAVLVALLEEGNRFAVLGSSNDIYVAQMTVAVALGLPYITVRRIIDVLVAEKILIEKYGSNVIVKTGNGFELRRPKTFQVDAAKLRRRLTVEQYKKMRDSHRCAKPFRPRSEHRGHRPSPPAPEAAPVAPTPQSAAPAAVPETSARHRRLTSREGPKLVAKMAELMRGYNKHVGLDGFAVVLDPGDSRYRAPLSQEKALISACMTLGIPYELALEHLKLCQWKFEEST
jgi:hypothetical protein